MCVWYLIESFPNLCYLTNLSLFIYVLSKKMLITSVKTKPVRDKWRKHDIRGSMAPFSHLLWLVYGLYMQLRLSDLCTLTYFTERSLVY